MASWIQIVHNFLFKGSTTITHMMNILPKHTLLTFSCSNKGIKDKSTQVLWFIQTFLFGFASLRLLIKYDPERSKQD